MVLKWHLFIQFLFFYLFFFLSNFLSGVGLNIDPKSQNEILTLFNVVFVIFMRSWEQLSARLLTKCCFKMKVLRKLQIKGLSRDPKNKAR